VLQLAQALLEAIQSSTPATAAAIGVDLKDIEGALLTMRRLIATGMGVKVEGGKLSGEITSVDLRETRGSEAPGPQCL
jgi:hypothetical protein